MDKKKIRFLKNLSTGLVIAAVVFAFLIAGIRVFGVQVYGVLTGSMEPAYPTGSLIYVRRVDPDDLRVNDVITFSISPNVIATHRIVEIVPDENNPAIVRYRTKGDANNDVDAALVSASNIIGKAMFAIPQMGYIASYIQQPPGIYVAILICGLMIAFVFYTDSLENKQKSSFHRGSKRDYAPERRSGAHQPVRQRASSRQGEYPQQPQSSRQRAYLRQSGSSRQSGYPRQGEFSRQSESSRQRAYPRQGESSRQRAYSRQVEPSRQSGYPRQSEPSRQRAYPRQSEPSRQRAYPRRSESSRQSGYPQQSGRPR